MPQRACASTTATEASHVDEVLAFLAAGASSPPSEASASGAGISTSPPGPRPSAAAGAPLPLAVPRPPPRPPRDPLPAGFAPDLAADFAETAAPLPLPLPLPPVGGPFSVGAFSGRARATALQYLARLCDEALAHKTTLARKRCKACMQSSHLDSQSQTPPARLNAPRKSKHQISSITKTHGKDPNFNNSLPCYDPQLTNNEMRKPRRHQCPSRTRSA